MEESRKIEMNIDKITSFLLHLRCWFRFMMNYDLVLGKDEL